MNKKIHYIDGCPWADGSVQMADTNQTKDWERVTCKHCLKNRAWTMILLEAKKNRKYKLNVIGKNL